LFRRRAALHTDALQARLALLDSVLLAEVTDQAKLAGAGHARR
jgi:hypothetical protein